MTKITKEDIQLLKTAGWCEEESQDCDWKKVEQIEKQILENQKIVDEIIKVYTKPDQHLVDKRGRHLLYSIVHQSTGKDIKDL